MVGTDPASADASRRLVRRLPFVLERPYLWALGLDGPALACAHLDCIDPVLPARACEDECPGWVLPYAVEFHRVEPASDATYCR